MQEPKKVAKAPLRPEWRFAPLLPIPARRARLSVALTRGYLRRKHRLLGPWYLQASPLPTRKERHRARRALEESASPERVQEESKGWGR